MTNENPYLTNPLHGTSLTTVLNEIVDHYGFPLLYAYLNINCFNKNPSINASVKFLKKTQWAREKVESFYLYQYKNLPRASDREFEKPPRERIIPNNENPKEPAELSFEDAENLRLKRAEKTRQRAEKRNTGKFNPWGNS
ncbi:VF530 family protein [Thalassotalea hakodatensis]|uniref:VF530 family protein n=1 Tax=Thalassotalea hakodatensis TaxID=3030492 RepID=UPI002573EE9F|nr:VF530 family DNA-binding protein [Thalassotalea hakodatensis]